MFEIELNGMYYRFSEGRLLEVMGLLDEWADEISSLPKFNKT